MSRLTANFLLLIAAALWGSAFVAQATAMRDLGPYYFTGIRFLLAAAVLLPFALREGKLRPDLKLNSRNFADFGLIGIVFFLAITIQQFGLQVTTVTNAAFLTSLYVVLVPVIGFVLYRELPHVIFWPAALASVAGVWLLGGGSLDALNWGDGAVIVCALFWAIHVAIIGKIGQRSGRPLALSFAQFLIAGTVATFLGWATESISWSQVKGAGVEILYTSLVSGCIAFTLQAIAQRWTRAADAAILLSAEALFGALMGAVLLDERLNMLGIAGCVLIMLAILAVQLVPILFKNKTA